MRLNSMSIECIRGGEGERERVRQLLSNLIHKRYDTCDRNFEIGQLVCVRCVEMEFECLHNDIDGKKGWCNTHQLVLTHFPVRSAAQATEQRCDYWIDSLKHGLFSLQMRQQVVLQFNACCDGASVLIFDILNWTTGSRHSPWHTMHFRLATGLWPFYTALCQRYARTKHFPIPHFRVPFNIMGFDMKVLVSRCTIIPQP